MQIFDGDILEFCENIIPPNGNLRIFYIRIGSFENQSLFGKLLDFIFKSEYSAVTDLTLEIVVDDISNSLLQHIQDNTTITVLRFRSESDTSFTSLATSSTYHLNNIETLEITNHDSLIHKSAILNQICTPRLTTLILGAITLNSDIQNYILRHCGTLIDLEVRSNTITTGWDLPIILQSCKSLQRITFDHGHYAIPNLTSHTLRTIRLDHFANMVTPGKADDIVRQMVHDLESFVLNKTALFSKLHTIQILDFHYSDLKKRKITQSTLAIWSAFLSECDAKNIYIQDILGTTIIQEHLRL